jgi:hypothetical protein
MADQSQVVPVSIGRLPGAAALELIGQANEILSE